MIVKVQFDTANAAFEDAPLDEFEHILATAAIFAANAVSNEMADAGSLMDSWGNTVGSWAVEREED